MLSAAERQLQRVVPHSAHANAILKKTLDKGTGWYSIGAIKPTEIILSVPAGSWLPYSSNFASMEATRNSPQFIGAVENLVSKFKAVNSKTAESGGSWQKLEASIHLAVKLMLDCDDDNAYMNALLAQTKEPAYVPLPITLKTSPAFSFLEGTSALKAVKERQLMYSYFADQLFGAGSPRSARFAWVMSQVLSRALSSPANRSAGGAPTPESESIPFTLVPMLDFVNHSASPNAKYEYCGRQHQFTLYPLRQIGEDEEITISYGEQRSNASFFALYGFIDKDSSILGTFQYSLQILFAKLSSDEESMHPVSGELTTYLNSWKLDQSSIVVEGGGVDGITSASGEAAVGVIEINDALMSVSFTADLNIFHYLDQLRPSTVFDTGSETGESDWDSAATFVEAFRAAFEDVLHSSRICVLRCEDVLSYGETMSNTDFRETLKMVEEKRYVEQLVSASGTGTGGSTRIGAGVISLRNEANAVSRILEYIEKEKLALLAPTDTTCSVRDAEPTAPGLLQLQSYCQDLAAAERLYWVKMLAHMESYLVLLLAADGSSFSNSDQ